MHLVFQVIKLFLSQVLNDVTSLQEKTWYFLVYYQSRMLEYSNLRSTFQQSYSTDDLWVFPYITLNSRTFNLIYLLAINPKHVLKAFLISLTRVPRG